MIKPLIDDPQSFMVTSSKFGKGVINPLMCHA